MAGCLGWGWWALDGPVPAWAHTRDFGATSMSSDVIVLQRAREECGGGGGSETA